MYVLLYVYLTSFYGYDCSQNLDECEYKTSSSDSGEDVEEEEEEREGSLVDDWAAEEEEVEPEEEAEEDNLLEPTPSPGPRDDKRRAGAWMGRLPRNYVSYRKTLRDYHGTVYGDQDVLLDGEGAWQPHPNHWKHITRE